MQRQYLNIPSFVVGLSLLFSLTSNAEENLPADNWTLRLTPQVSYVGYLGSKLRNDMVNAGIYFDAQYQDLGGIAAAATYSYLNFKSGLSPLNQAAEYLSGRLNFYPAYLPGRISWRLDGHQINNDDTTNETNDVQVIAPQVSFLSNGKSFYIDVGYAISFYGKSHIGNDSLTIQQWTPTLGLGFNNNYDWLQVRLYDVSASNNQRAMHDHTDAAEIKYTHYFKTGIGWIPQWISIGGLAGNRQYAVDSDTALVYNLADEQKGGGFLSAQWKLAEHYKATLSAAYDLYETRDYLTADRQHYSGITGYLGLSAQW
jgi:hypothetical protein